VFDERSMYERVRATGVLGPELFARLYHVRPDEVLFSEYPAGNAFKATIPRLVASGDVGDTDVYGAKYSSGGAPVWARQLGGTDTDVGAAVASSPSGYIVSSGYFYGSGAFGGTSLTSAGGADAFVTSLAP